MIETIKVTCPDCGVELVVNKKTGKVLEVRRPLIEDSTGDRFQDAVIKMRRADEEMERKFQEARRREAEKMKKLDQIFKESLKDAEKEDLEKPLRDIDLE
ncbi:MAG: hypothetical protein Kow0059_11290 [Candidatus Sumerlaeia bacterium]